MQFAYPPPALQGLGPIIETDIGITEAHEQYLRNQGQAIPSRIRCRLLIDTGASKTLVRHDIAERAGLKLINENHPIHGIGVDTTGKIYSGRVWFVCQSHVDARLTHNIWLDVAIAGATLPNTKTIDGLIGRDVLSHFDFVYSGKDGKFSLQYRGPSQI